MGEAAEELGLFMKDCPGVPILLIANKQDLPNAMSAQELSTRFDVNTKMKDNPFTVVATSFTLGDGVDDVVEWLTDMGRVEAFRIKKAEEETKKICTSEEKKKSVLELWLEVEDEEDDEFLRKFADYTLDKWDHRAHLRLAWIILNRYGRKEGIQRIVEGIQKFIENSDRARKTNFHLTMTYFWCHMVFYAIHATVNPKNDFKTFLVMNPQLSNGGLFLDYYERDTMLNNMESRRTLVMPDKKPLPSIIPGEAEALGIRMAKQFNLEPSSDSKDDKEDDDAMFLQKFEAGEISQIDEHRTFLRVIWCYILAFEKTRRIHHSRAKIVDKIFKVLQKEQDFNFHFTRTYFWIQMVHGSAVSDNPLIENFSSFLEHHQELGSPGLIAEYYSGALVSSDRAKTEMVLPDLKPMSSVVKSS
eukprot:TRINITY_DN5454_c0_g1_i1.p1 TRINITY_DN5454_c0_g1~~TRINITY_DN5454_c0_g1_i1.p1  ORF type:complete len:443 (+),score=128.94 TRINITY_DN5454_c0_g1_i1:84-1331(+)